MLDPPRWLWRALVATALLASSSFYCGFKGALAETLEQKEADLILRVIASDATPDTLGQAMDEMPVLALIQPPNGKRLPYELGKETTLTIQFEILSNPLLLQAIDAKVCVEFDEIGSHTDDEGNTSLTFKALGDDTSHCFSGRALELKATGFAPGGYRLRTILRVPNVAVDEGNFTYEASFEVVPKVEFEPSYEFRRVEEWQSVQAGLDVKMPIGGNDFRKARIPHTWKLQAFVLDEMGNKKGAGKIQRVTIKRTDPLSAVRAAIAEAALSEGPCLTLSIGGSKSDWAALESAETATVETTKLFETGAEIAGVLDRETGTCACHVPEKSRACHVVLTKLETCEKEAGGINLGDCSDEVTAVAHCFTRCSVIGDPYASVDLKPEEEYETNETMLSPAIGKPPLPLQKGLSELQWGADGHSQWARCKLCSYTPGIPPSLGIHVLAGGKLPLGLPSQLASSPYAMRFRTQRATHPAPLEAIHEEYDEASSRCGSGKRVVSSPAFVIAVFDVINVHHLMSELLLPVFHTIVSTYGAFRDDALIFLEVGHPEQAPRLQRLLREAATGDVALGLLFRLTRRPVGSAATLERGIQVIVSGESTGALDKSLCFRDLHIGFDFRNTSSMLGLRAKFIDLASSEGGEVARWQHMLREHLFPLTAPAEEGDKDADEAVKEGEKDGDAAVQVTSWSPPLPVGVLFVKRLQTRKFKNFVELKEIARAMAKDVTTVILATYNNTFSTTTDTMASEEKSTSPESTNDAEAGIEASNDTSMIFPPDWKGWTNEAVMERLSFSQQVEQLRKTTVLVAILGQGAVNAAFMRPGSSLVLVVPPNMDEEKYVFANVAVASGVHVFLVEIEDSTSSEEKTADEKTKLLEEAKNKKEVLVDPAKFKATLHLAIMFASACDFQSCKLLPEARVHFWPEAEQHWMSAEKQIAAEKEKTKAEKEAKEHMRAEKKLEEAIAKAKAQLAELEGKMLAMVLANTAKVDATEEQEPQHEEL